MEVAVVSALAKCAVTKLVEVAAKKYNQLSDSEVQGNINYMKAELGMIAAAMEDELSGKRQSSFVLRMSMDAMRELAHDIEDCLDRFLPCAACEGKPIGDPVGMCMEMGKLRERVKNVYEQRIIYGVGGDHASAAAGPSTATEQMHRYAAEADLVGIAKPKQEILELLVRKEVHRRVISISGFGGSGKTALARAVYDCPQVIGKFDSRAWAVASKDKDVEGLLKDILTDLRRNKAPASAPAPDVPEQVSQLEEEITNHLQDTRYLIVLDDIDTQLWKSIEPIFPKETTMSRILVTTTMRSVANSCSSGDGYVYSMRTLSAEHSLHLLKNKVPSFRECPPDLEEGPIAIVHKCDGLPLALISVVNALESENVLTGEDCKRITQNLGELTDQNKNHSFTKLRQVVLNNYSSLHSVFEDSLIRTCLLYTSLFPDDRPLSRNSLIRRLSAEGYIHWRYPHSELEVADEDLKQLIDRNIIRPIDASNNAKVKSFRTQRIMHQFMLHKSRSYNFITSFGDKNRRNFRHLIIQNHTNGTSAPGKQASCLKIMYNTFRFGGTAKDGSKKLRPRSLTVFGSAVEAFSNFTDCKQLRVLDLHECNDLTEEYLKEIYGLLHLKYLSLGSTVSNLSEGIKSLHCLETLDLRKTKIETLLVEVISLPHLAHLLGKIKLDQKLCVAKRVEKLLSKRGSNLQTLAGIIINESSGFPQLMCHMRKLRKLKVWSFDSCWSSVTKAIQKFTQAGSGTATDAISLSLNFDNYSEDLLDHLKNSAGYIKSLKLQGSMSHFPQFVKSLRGLKELCLTSTKLKGCDLARLRELNKLVYLKLVEADLEGLEINVGDFLSLQRLCLVVEAPKFPTIKEGALLKLVSLQLLCKGLVGLLKGVQLKWLKDLQEVALDSMVNPETILLWESDVKNHPKRPRFFLLKRFDRTETEPKVKYVATEDLIIDEIQYALEATNLPDPSSS